MREALNACGVCTAQSFDRSSVRVTVVPFSTYFTVSQMWQPTTAAPVRFATFTVSAIVSGFTHGRAPSWTTTTRVSESTSLSPFITESWRFGPPATTARTLEMPNMRTSAFVATKALVRMFGISKVRAVVAGGPKRQDSVMNGLKEVDSDTRVVVVHDGARPCVKPETIAETVKVAKRTGAAVVGCHIWDTVKYVEKGTTVTRTEDRSKLWAVQTPQAFSASLIRRAYAEVAKRKAEVTDDAAAVELLGEPVKIVETDVPNLKITTVEDLRIAAAVVLKS